MMAVSISQTTLIWTLSIFMYIHRRFHIEVSTMLTFQTTLRLAFTILTLMFYNMFN